MTLQEKRRAFARRQDPEKPKENPTLRELIPKLLEEVGCGYTGEPTLTIPLDELPRYIDPKIDHLPTYYLYQSGDWDYIRILGEDGDALGAAYDIRVVYRE